MSKPTLSDRLSAPSPGVPTGRLILIIIAVLIAGFGFGAIVGKLFPPAPGPPATQSATRPATATSTSPTTVPR